MKFWKYIMDDMDFSYLYFDLDKKGICIGIYGYLIGIDF